MTIEIETTDDRKIITVTTRGREITEVFGYYWPDRECWVFDIDLTVANILSQMLAVEGGDRQRLFEAMEAAR